MVWEAADDEQFKTSQPAAGVISEIALGEPDYRTIKVSMGRNMVIHKQHTRTTVPPMDVGDC